MGMRILLLPVTTRRTLLYCERLVTEAAAKTSPPSIMDKVQTRASKLWSDWERNPAGSWQHRVVTYGNAGLRRVAFEEWGLKSVPPLSALERQDAETTREGAAPSTSSPAPQSPHVEVLYPPSALPSSKVLGVLQRLSTEREMLHRRRLMWCFMGMPLTIPIGILPVIPNLPFFYLAYRAWSHWRALAGGKHLQFLLQHKRLAFVPSPALDRVYAAEQTARTLSGTVRTTTKASRPLPNSTAARVEEPERLLLSHPRGSQAVAEALSSHALEVELERAIWQVETALEKESKAAKAAKATTARQSTGSSKTE